MGNHDHMMLAVLGKKSTNMYGGKDGAFYMWRSNGGQTTMDNYKQGEELLFDEEHVDFLSELPLYYRIKYSGEGFDKVIITHAAIFHSITEDKKMINKHRRMSDFPAERSFLWCRGWPAPIKNTLQVFGHTAVYDPVIKDNICLIDGGCVYGKELWVLDVDSLSVIRQPKLD